MTTQETDTVCYQGQGFSVVQAEPLPFSPWQHGIEPEPICSSNGSGFVAGFAITQQQLYLSYLRVGHTPRRKASTQNTQDPLSLLLAGSKPLPLLNQVAAESAGMGYWHYQNLQLALSYTGTLLLQPAASPSSQWLELSFKHGQLLATKTIAPE